MKLFYNNFKFNIKRNKIYQIILELFHNLLSQSFSNRYFFDYIEAIKEIRENKKYEKSFL